MKTPHHKAAGRMHAAAKTAVIMLVVSLAATAAGIVRPSDDLNRRAARAKATHLAHSAVFMLNHDALTSDNVFGRALALAPEDTAVRLAATDWLIISQQADTAKYYGQLNLLAAVPDPAARYYRTLLDRSDSYGLESDSLLGYRIAMQAYGQNPREYYPQVIGTGINYLSDKRFVRMGHTITDTLDLSPADITFGEELLVFVDTIESRYGYSLWVDKRRSELYSLLDRKDDMVRMIDRLESLYPDDPDAIQFSSLLAHESGDKLKQKEMARRQFELDPRDNSAVFLYITFSEDTTDTDGLREIVDAIVRRAADSELSIDQRMLILGGLVTGRSSDLTGETIKNDSVMHRVNRALSDIITEDPDNQEIYLRSIFFTRNWWPNNYGYKHWIEAAEALPDTSTILFDIAQALSNNVPKDEAFEKQMLRLSEVYKTEIPFLYAPMRMAVGKYFYGHDEYARAIEMLKDITADQLKVFLEKKLETGEFSPQDSDDTPESQALNVWMSIQNVISDSQINLGLVDEGLATLRKLLQINPDNAETLNNMAYFMAENDRDLDEALTLVEKSLSINPENFNALDTRGWIKFKSGDSSGALIDLALALDNFSISMTNDVMDAANPKSLVEIIEDGYPSFSIPMFMPIIGHILAILDKEADSDPAQLERIAEALERFEPDNAELAAYRKHNPKKTQ